MTLRAVLLQEGGDRRRAGVDRGAHALGIEAPDRARSHRSCRRRRGAGPARLGKRKGLAQRGAGDLGLAVDAPFRREQALQRLDRFDRAPARFSRRSLRSRSRSSSACPRPRCASQSISDAGRTAPGRSAMKPAKQATSIRSGWAVDGWRHRLEADASGHPPGPRVRSRPARSAGSRRRAPTPPSRRRCRLWRPAWGRCISSGRR